VTDPPIKERPYYIYKDVPCDPMMEFGRTFKTFYLYPNLVWRVFMDEDLKWKGYYTKEQAENLLNTLEANENSG